MNEKPKWHWSVTYYGPFDVIRDGLEPLETLFLVQDFPSLAALDAAMDEVCGMAKIMTVRRVLA